MSYVMKNKKLFAVVMLVVMMSSVLVLPASAALNYGMGGVSFTDSNGVQYAEGYIWNTYGNPYELNGRIESDVSGSVEIGLFAQVHDHSISEPNNVYWISDYGYGSSWATACVLLDESIHEPLQASADFTVNGVLQYYDYPGGWNWGW